jgi:hypothetical protein
MNVSGKNLDAADFEKLAHCGISQDLAERALLRRVASHEGAAIVGRNGSADYSGIVFPYLWPGQDGVREYRLRRDNPEFDQQPDGTLRERAKYLSPPGKGNMLYFVPGTHDAWLSDASIPIVITEGEKKTLALWEAAWHGLSDAAERPRYLPIGLSGVWNWRGVVGKRDDAAGKRRDVKGPIPDLDRVRWPQRQVTILFDTNVTVNDSVQRARHFLTEELERRRGSVRWFRWPADTPAGINGIDDAIAIWGPERIIRMIDESKPHRNIAREIRVGTLAELRAEHFNPPTCIVEDVLAEGETIALVGRPKAGKSRLGQQLALNLSRGQSFLGHKIPQPRTVLYLDLENRPEGVRSRFQKLSRSDDADKRIFVYAPETLAENPINMRTDEGFNSLQQVVADIRPDVLVVDTWRLILCGDENKTEVVLAALKRLSALRTSLPKLGTVLIHHLRKQQGDNSAHLRVDPSTWVENASGHYCFIGHVDACYGLEREVCATTGDELIVFGGVARNAAPRTLLLEDDPETLMFTVSVGEDAAERLFTTKENETWSRLRSRTHFSFTGAVEITGSKNKKMIVSTLRKAETLGLVEHGDDGLYRPR